MNETEKSTNGSNNNPQTNWSNCSQLSLIPNLPNEIARQCIARVPRANHTNLHLVSRSWRSLLRSPDFYQLRSQLNCIQPFIYITVLARSSSSFQWLMIDPHAPNTKKLRHLPPPPPPFPSTGSTTAVLGPRIFFIGGSVPSSAVWTFDARFNHWEMAPSMSVPRKFVAAGSIDGKIYVLGGCPVDSPSWAEVFDPAVGSWATVPSPVFIREKNMRESAVLGGKLFAKANHGIVVYDPAADGAEAAASAWSRLAWNPIGWNWKDGAAAVDGILYCYAFGKIRGYYESENKWEDVKGTEFLLGGGAKLADVGGRLSVVWETRSGNSKDMAIGCAEIEVVRESSGGGLRGSVEWSDIVELAVPKGSPIVNCLAVGL